MHVVSHVCQVCLLHIPRKPGHVAHAVEVLLELFALPVQEQALLLGVELEGVLFLAPNLTNMRNYMHAYICTYI